MTDRSLADVGLAHRLDARGSLAHLSVEGQRLVGAAREALGRPVPTCPGWSVDDLVAHVGRIYHRAARMVRERRRVEIPLRTIAPPSPGPGRIDWLDDGLRDLAHTLAEAGPGSPVWNWTSGPQVAGFWFRRMAHETAVHRWDAEAVLRQPAPVAREAALDGIDELLALFLPEEARRLPPLGLGGVLRLHCTDACVDWYVEATATTVRVLYDQASADATVSGSASDLMMFLWNRRTPDDLTVEGDATIPARWRAELRW